MPKAKGRAKQFADWEEKPAQDYDPEAEPKSDNDESDSEESVDDAAGTEHYVAVGKSKLRRKDALSLGPQYRGARVSRDALDQSDDEIENNSGSGSDDYESAQEDFDDPDQADLDRDQLEHEGEDVEIDSGDAFGESDEEKFEGYTFRGSSQPVPVKGKRISRPTAADFMDEEAEESEDSEGRPDDDDEDDEDSEEDDDEEASDLNGFIDDEDEDEDEEEEDDDHESESGQSDSDDAEDDKPAKKGRSDVQSLMTSGTKSVAGAFADSVQKDIAKGNAVRQQRKAFDAALNIRIRLQKALVSVNSFAASEETEPQSEPYEAAEAAAIKLLNTIGNYRFDMQGKTGQKRKRSLDTDASNEKVWERMQGLERPAVTRRKAVLENWSKKVKATQNASSGISKGSKLVKVDEPLTMLLENQLQDTERLVKRTQVPRSCAPVQVSQKVNEDPEIYDDADFYQLLLKELVDQRTTDTSAGAVGQAATIRYAAVKEAKNKKHVDTKASKGRKMRFNVHDKLQNFMAPEDRRSWEQHAIDRFFGTLFGQKMVLNEDEVSDQEMDDAVDAEEEGLRLFRN